MEIEYQDSKSKKEELKEFINLINIKGSEQDMYGGIIKCKLEQDFEFKKIFDKNLNKILEKN